MFTIENTNNISELEIGNSIVLDNELINAEITEERVIETINSIKPNKAAGGDGFGIVC